MASRTRKRATMPPRTRKGKLEDFHEEDQEEEMELDLEQKSEPECDASEKEVLQPWQRDDAEPIDEGEEYGEPPSEDEEEVDKGGKKKSRANKPAVFPDEGAKQAHYWKEQYKGEYTVPDDYQPPVIPHTPNLPYIPYNPSKYMKSRPWVPTNQELISIEARKYHPNIRGPLRHVMTVAMLKANRLPDEFLPLPDATPRQKLEAMLAREGFEYPDDLPMTFLYDEGFRNGQCRGRRLGGDMYGFFDPDRTGLLYGFHMGILNAIDNCLKLDVITAAQASEFRTRIDDALCAPPGGHYLVEHTWHGVESATDRVLTTLIEVGNELQKIHKQVPCKGLPGCAKWCECDLPEDAKIPGDDILRWRQKWWHGVGYEKPSYSGDENNENNENNEDNEDNKDNEDNEDDEDDEDNEDDEDGEESEDGENDEEGEVDEYDEEMPDAEDEDKQPKFRYWNGPGTGYQPPAEPPADEDSDDDGDVEMDDE